jgi:hypothetical protein
LNYRQTAGQTIGMFLAKFDQLEGYLPRPLPFDEKMAAIRIVCGIRRSFHRTSCTVFVAGWTPHVLISINTAKR